MSWQPYATFAVQGQPKGQPRPRAVNRNGKAAVYDPGTAEGWKDQVVLAARGARPAQPLTGPVRIRIAFYFDRPARLRRRKDPDGLIPHTAKPDSDNAAKAVLDALTEAGLWRDDAQVSSLTAEQYYAARGQPDGALVQVYTDQEGEP